MHETGELYYCQNGADGESEGLTILYQREGHGYCWSLNTTKWTLSTPTALADILADAIKRLKN